VQHARNHRQPRGGLDRDVGRIRAGDWSLGTAAGTGEDVRHDPLSEKPLTACVGRQHCGSHPHEHCGSLARDLAHLCAGGKPRHAKR
jgi:hypothetical protein